MQELQNVDTENVTCSKDVPSCTDGEHVVSAESSGYDNRKTPQESPMLRSNVEKQESNGHYYNVHERDEDMESALQHQAQLIGQYEEEEKAQREWEEKFRENNSGAQVCFINLNWCTTIIIRIHLRSASFTFHQFEQEAFGGILELCVPPKFIL